MKNNHSGGILENVLLGFSMLLLLLMLAESFALLYDASSFLSFIILINFMLGGVGLFALIMAKFVGGGRWSKNPRR